MEHHFYQIMLLGFVEGLTEFIPVSSTGHLILLVDLLKFQGPPGKVFEVVIQLGAILAICVLYRHKIISVLLGLWHDQGAQLFTRNIMIAFLPAMVVGALAHDIIKQLLFNPTVVSINLVIGGFLILWIEGLSKQVTIREIEQISPKRALAIGGFQLLALIPGTSRSGATIMGSLLLGLDRKTAAEFSFFLAIPTMLGAASYDLFKIRHQLTFDNVETISIGFVAAFIAALLVVGSIIRFISKHGFRPFAWYRIILGTTMLGLLYA